MSELHLSSVEEASPRLAKWWSGVTSLRQEWQVSALSSRWPSLTTHHRRLSLAPLPAPSPSPHEALPRTLLPPHQALLKNLRSGDYSPFVYRAVLFGNKGKTPSQPWNSCSWPTLLRGADGQRSASVCT